MAEALAGQGGGNRRTVAGFFELVWLPAKQAEVDRSTFDQYAWAVRRHIVPGLGQCKLGELEPMVLDRWFRRLGDARRADGGRSLSPTSVRLVRKVLSMGCADAVDRGVLADNPVRRTEVPKAERSSGVVWTADEARRFLAAADTHRLGPAFHLAIAAGLRRGELLGLRWSDLDLDAGQLRVAQQLMVEGGRARLKPVPEADRRTVALAPSVAGMLLEHRNRQHAERAAPEEGADDDLVFRAPGGGWLTPERFTRVMELLIAQSQVRRITPNCLRRAGQILERSAPNNGAERL
ncbi:MAG: tyrosine-type recombinase/integrase [Acidimicrobiia bacterium]